MSYWRRWIDYQAWLNGPLSSRIAGWARNLGACRCGDVEGPHRHYRRTF